LDEALLIGARIRERGLSTTVPDGAICTSACGLIWLAGTSRFVEGKAELDFMRSLLLDESQYPGLGMHELARIWLGSALAILR